MVFDEHNQPFRLCRNALNQCSCVSPMVSRTAGVEESLADSSKRANAAVVLLVVLGGDGVKGVCLELEELKER